MIDVGLTLLVLPQQASERIDFDLQPGVVLVAALAFILVNLLIAAALYPYLKGGSSTQQETQSGAAREAAAAEEMTPSGEEELEERVDDFLEDIEQSS
jgi:hypothetical protein